MKKVLFLAFVLCCITGNLVYGQSYYYLQSTGTDAAFTLGKQNVVIASPSTSDILSSTQTIPFTWSFYGQSVSTYKISDNGYITFNTSSTTSNPTNVSLPSSSAPTNAIFAFWEDLVLSQPDATYLYDIQNWTYGTAPNRIHVIQWFQIHVAPLNSSNTDLVFAIRLFESGPKAFDIVYSYIVTPSGTAATTSATVGCQNTSGTVSTMVSSSMTFPNVPSTANTDDVVYEFYYGTQPSYDLSATSVIVNNPVKISSSNPIGATIRNLGSQTVTSFDLYYTVNGVKSAKTTINQSIAPGATITANSTAGWTPTSPGLYTIQIWGENINNGNADQNNSNDTATIQTLANNGIYGTKRALLEEGTGTWCGWCPEGALILNGLTQSEGDNLVVMAYHNDDPMSFTNGDNMNNTYSAPGFPYGMVDRQLFPQFATTVGLMRNYWANAISTELQATTPVNISISNVNYTPSNNQLTFDVGMDFVDVAYGDLRINVAIMEDWVGGYSGTNYTEPTWEQHNYASSNYPGGSADPTNAMYNYPVYCDTTPAGGHWFNHHVGRKYVSATWGDNVDATSGPHMVNQGTLTKSYSTVLSSAWNSKNVFIIAFVSNYNSDITQRNILNVRELNINSSSTGIEQKVTDNIISSIYPNPVTDNAVINFSVEKTSKTTLDVYNTLGQKLISLDEQTYSPGSHLMYINTSSLEKGAYIAVLKIGDQTYSQKFIK